MKILWMSVPPWAKTAYGLQSVQVVNMLLDAGHDVDYFAFQNHCHSVLPIALGKHRINVYPRAMNGDPWGRDILRDHVRQSGAQLVVSLIDTWMCPGRRGDGPAPDEDPRQRRGQPLGSWADCGVPWLPWVPVDHDPVRPPVVASLMTSSGEKLPLVLAMCEYGRAQLAGAGFSTLTIPHGLDPEVFQPGDMAEARAKLELDPGAFCVLILASNTNRKAWWEQLSAFAEFRKRHEDTQLYMHTDPVRVGGEPLIHYVHQLGLAGAVTAASTYVMEIGGYGTGFCAELYRAANVTMLCSYGEGFGIPLIESQACGTPVVYGDYTSMPELVECGWPVRHASRKPVERIAGLMYVPDVAGIVAALEQSYEAWRAGGEEFARKRAAASEAIRARYAWSALAPLWEDALRQAEQAWAPWYLRKLQAEVEAAGGRIEISEGRPVAVRERLAEAAALAGEPAPAAAAGAPPSGMDELLRRVEEGGEVR